MATTSIILDTRRMKKDGRYPVKLRVIHNRVTQDYPTVFNLSEADHRKLTAPKLSEQLQAVRKELRALEEETAAAIREMDEFSFPAFEQLHAGHKLLKIKARRITVVAAPESADTFDYSPFKFRFTIFKEKHTSPTGLSVVFLSYIKKLLQQGRVGSAVNYQRTYRSLRDFRGNITLQDISAAYLYQYEAWMLGRGASRTTVGIVLRPLRAVFNEAIEEKLIRKEKHYPFGRRKYQIPASRNLKKALTQEELKRIYFYQPGTPQEAAGKAYWLFCYLANGMNVKDMILLKWKNIQGEFLVFERFKTEKSTRTDQKPITVYLTEDLWEIIRAFGSQPGSPNDYLFGLLTPDMDAMKQYNVLHQVRKDINKAMKEISKELGIDKKVTTIVTRHSFSTQLKRAGVSTEFIQEALGHTNKKTTENYLDSFEKEVKKEYASKLTAFKKEGGGQ